MKKLFACCGLVIIFISLFQTIEANAARSIKIVPIRVYTAHGGRIGGTGCFTADMEPAWGVPPASIADMGVSNSSQRLSLVLTNLSTINQTVTLTAKAGSSVLLANSGGSATAVGSITGANPILAADWSSPAFVIPAGGSLNGEVEARCNDSQCGIQWNPNNGNPSSMIFGTNPPASCAGTPQICLVQETNLTLSLSVAEDRGGIQGHIFASAHRCNGLKDHFLAPPPSIAINGGRPF
jgi:hypothetical protein